MFVSDCISINEKGPLTIGSADTVELAKEFGTPAYIFDENEIRGNLRAFRDSVEEYYGGNGLVCYASKAFSCKEIYRICMQEGTGVDVVSGGELYTALSVGFPADKIVFHGNNKTPDELAMAVENGVGRIVVDNLTELETLNGIASASGKTVGIMLRIKPGVDAHTHDFIKTGQIDSKFGFALETGEALEAVKAAIAMPALKLRGLHCHIGSQIFDIDPFELAAEVMLNLYKQIKDETGVELDELNLGGGFGVRCHNITEKTGLLTGISSVDEDQDLMMITDQGTIIRTPASDLSILSRSAGGVIVMRLPEGQYVANFTVVAKEEENDESEDENSETDQTVDADVDTEAVEITEPESAEPAEQTDEE